MAEPLGCTVSFCNMRRDKPASQQPGSRAHFRRQCIPIAHGAACGRRKDRAEATYLRPFFAAQAARESTTVSPIARISMARPAHNTAAHAARTDDPRVRTC